MRERLDKSNMYGEKEIITHKFSTSACTNNGRDGTLPINPRFTMNIRRSIIQGR